jgi:hypothetical protein
MNFERHTDIKKAVGIGRDRIALKIYGLGILLAGDDRQWVKFQPANSAYTHSILAMINQEEISKEEILKLVTGNYNEEQDHNITSKFTQIKFELEYSQADIMDLREKGETEVKTVRYQLKMYELFQGKQILV